MDNEIDVIIKVSQGILTFPTPKQEKDENYEAPHFWGVKYEDEDGNCSFIFLEDPEEENDEKERSPRPKEDENEEEEPHELLSANVDYGGDKQPWMTHIMVFRNH